ncbi:HNH endonuclease [Thiobacillus sp.]|uniref:HNH endonuclease n=1 Tax=Thiobacillus sp. TaxID=924 RepID=UPI00286DDB4A|nr:HNH endonuclease [Thiobacillus sp.]
MNRWIDDICTALENLGGIAHRGDLLAEIKRIRPGPHPQSIEMTVQRTIQNHSSDSNGFRGEDLLYTVNGIGSGVWGLRSKLNPTPRASDIEEAENPDRIHTEIYRILRDTALARKIKLLHKNKCQLCGSSILLVNGETYAEAHHIKPLGRPHNGPDIAENIIVLCPNHHVQLDFGAMKLSREQIHSIHGHHIGAQFIEYHNSIIHAASSA